MKAARLAVGCMRLLDAFGLANQKLG